MSGINGQHQDRSLHGICRTCGLCCDGTLFKCAPLSPEDDLRIVKEIGLLVTEKKNKMHISLPCPMHSGECTVYPKRPSPCRTYICKLAKRYTNREITWEQAIAQVIEVKELKNELQKEAMKVYKTSGAVDMTELHKRLADISDTDGTTTYGKLLVKYAALIMRLSHLFIKSSAKQFMTESDNRRAKNA